MKIIFIFIFITGIFIPAESQVPIDPDATVQTKALYANLQKITGTGILFGHQDDMAYGVNWKNQPGRSDVKEVCGDYPAVFGWDVSKLGQRPFNIDSVDFERMKKWIQEEYAMGGVITISWHLDNPVTGGSSWDNAPAVYAIVPGGEKHEFYKQKLDLFVEFINDLKSEKGNEPIPIIFRPFHEHTGKWFWWGDGNCTADEFIRLWQFTVNYLRDKKGLHNLLYAYSTDIFNDEAHFLKFYPGDAYVDILSYDDYHGIKTKEGLKGVQKRLSILTELAEKRNKIAALTETGLESVNIDNWHSQYLLEAIKGDEQGKKIAWVLLWRNANSRHHFTTYKGHPSEEDFRKFYEDPYTLFLKDLPPLYR